MLQYKKISSLQDQIADKQQKLALHKQAIDAGIYRIKFNSRQQLSKPPTLIFGFCLGLFLGVIGKKSPIKTVADDVVSTSLTRVRKWLIIPLIGQVLFKRFNRNKSIEN